MASGQGSHWLTESAKLFNLCVISPPEICVNLLFIHIHTAPQSVDNLFHSLIVLCEKEYFLISNIH